MKVNLFFFDITPACKLYEKDFSTITEALDVLSEHKSHQSVIVTLDGDMVLKGGVITAQKILMNSLLKVS